MAKLLYYLSIKKTLIDDITNTKAINDNTSETLIDDITNTDAIDDNW
jgi:hypothetical protein